MRIAIALVKQESNTFSPVHATLEDFEQEGLYYDKNFLDKFKSRGEIGGFLDVFEEEKIDAKLLPIIHAYTHATGRIETKTFRFIEEKLIAGLKKALPLDAMFFALHGAGTTEEIDDMDGYLLSVVRDVIGQEVPIVACLDHHANITQKMIQLADIMVGHETQPHKFYETGRKAAQSFFSLLRGDFKPVVAWEKIPLIVGHLERLVTAEGEPMKEWFDLARELEKEPGVISISNFPMQPWLDVEEAGLATIVYTDNNPRLAMELAAQLANKAWSLRERFLKGTRVSPQEAVQYAVKAKEGPIILSDASDSAGAPFDNTCILKEMLRQQINCTALVPIYDPEVYHQATKAGLGSTITVKVGGKFGGKLYQPVEVTAKVTGITEGFEVDLTKGGKLLVDGWSFMVQRGTVILEVGSIKIMVSESRIPSGRHPDIYRYFGIEPAEAKMIVLRTGCNFYYYDSIKKGVLRVDCPGYSQADLSKFEWKRAPRPIYPIDKDKIGDWQANPKLKQ